jgi:hypothetical protein
MPLWWDMAYYCLNLQDGTIRHFPAGTYNEQIATRDGRIELSMMQTTYNAWRTFKTSADKWTDHDRRIAALAMPSMPEPTRRLNSILHMLWAGSPWARIVLRHLRRLTDG